jgi:hypothetical protein
MHAVAQVVRTRPLSGLRDSQWLKQELEHVWASHFADIPRVNRVEISFVGSWKSRLGVISLSQDTRTSYIGINSLLCLPEAPYQIARITIAHELVHYAHGFGSPLPRQHKHPHRGRIVDRELLARGFRQEWLVYQDWVRDHWYDFYDRCALNPDVVAPAAVTGNARETYASQ